MGTLAAIFLILYFLQPIVAELPSGVNRLSTEGLQMILNLYKDPILQMMNNASIPDIEFSSNGSGVSMDFKLKNLLFQQLEIDKIWITSVEDVGFGAGIEDGTAIVNFDWSYQMRSYPFSSEKGIGQMVIDDFYGSCIVTVTLEGDSSVTHINGMYIDIGSFNLTITGNGITSNLISLVIDLLSPFLTNYVGEIMANMFVSAANSIANKNNHDNTRTIDDEVELFWSFVDDMKFDASSGTNFVKILYKPIGYEVEKIPYSPSPVPGKTSNDPLQYMFDFVVFDSAWFSYIIIQYFNQRFDNILSGEDLSVKTLSKFIPEILNNYPESTHVHSIVNCDKLNYSEVFYTGIYRNVQCEITFFADFNDFEDDIYNDADGYPIIYLSGKVGLAEQTKLFYEGRNLGLTFFYHNNTLDNMEILVDGIDVDDEMDSTELFLFCITSFLLPLFNSWGEHISFTHFSSVGLKPINITMDFEDSFVALGYEPALDS